MCNLYLMYYSSIDDGGFNSCGEKQNNEIIKKLPFDSDKLLPDMTNNVNDVDSRAYRRRRNRNIIHAEQVLN